MRLARRLREVSSSYTLSLMAKRESRVEPDGEIIDLGSGGPDLDTPENIKEAAKQAIDENFTRLIDPYGLVHLRESIALKYQKLYDTDHQTGEIIITSGAKNALFACALSLFGDGDEVIIFAPYWATYAEQVRLAGAMPVFIETEKGKAFQPEVEKLEAFLTPSTKAVILNNPCNPTGAVILPETLKKIAVLSLQKDFYIICDECYEHFVFDTPYESIARYSQKVKDRLIIINAFSESYAMMGWRIGYALGPKLVIDAMVRVNSHDCSQPSSISQRAALEAIMGPQDFIQLMIGQMREKREVMFEALNRTHGFTCLRPQGTFFMFPDVQGLYGRLEVESATEVSNYLLKHARVLTVPGEVFGCAGHIRFSFAPPLERIHEGMKRIEQCITSVT